MGRTVGQSEPRGLRLLRWGSLLLSLVGAVLVGLVTYQREREAALAQAYENVALVRQYAERLFQTQTILHAAAQAHADSVGEEGYLRSRAFHEFLAATEASQSFTFGVAVADLNGPLLASSRAYPVDASFARREYLAAIAGGASIVVDRIRVEPAGQDAMVVAQPFRLGSFEGAIVSAVAVSEIRKFLEDVAPRPGQAASLLREDGKLLVRRTPSTATFLDPEAPAMQAIRTAPTGDYEATAVTDGIRRLYAYSQLGELPVFANFGVSIADVRAIWIRSTLPFWLLLLGVGVFSWLLSLMISRSISERSAQEEEMRLRREAEQKSEQQTRFMMELNHRIKNNLALVNSMIGHQMRQGSLNGDALRARIQAVADVHDLLYRAADASHIDLGELIEQICASPALIPEERDIKVTCEVEKGIVIDASQATPLALVVVELLTNSVKHAFPGNSGGHIAFGLVSENDGTIDLHISDDGIGMTQGRTRDSGIGIATAFVKQIGGAIEHLDGSGTGYRISFRPVRQ